ncbi:cupin domain-containing protein [Methanomassiliicoccales archaeon LGM-DZ1]|nr:cupin domain-containing protein [Methanomassiliicoccales archaeon LGM-DZ1]
MSSEEVPKDLSPFDAGEPNPYGAHFEGKSYLKMFAESPVGIANVTFEPGCRNHWHIHHKGGQVLICIAGCGWYQAWGEEPRGLHPGDVIAIPPEVKHWHGAAKDSWFSHIAVEVPAPGASTEWCGPVSDADYSKLP